MMDVVRFKEAPVYTASNHDDVVARRLQGGEASSADFVTVGHSLFAAGSVVPMDAALVGKVYIVTHGAITIEQADGGRYVLQSWDSVFVPPGEARAVRNESGAPASLIVITPTL